jgi:predicted dehydrogenase
LSETLIHTKPRLSFVGVGWIGRHRLKAAADSRLAEIDIVYDPSEECLLEAKKIIPGATYTTSFNEAVSDTNIDGIVIASPSALHMKQCISALENNKAVFCQKPLGRNSEEVRKIIKAAEQADKLLAIDFSYRHTNAFQSICNVINTGDLGKIFAVDLKFHNAYGPDKEWFYNKDLSGGGCVLDLGIHLIDLMLVALSFPAVINVSSRLYKKGLHVNTNYEVEDFANASIELVNDITATLSCSWHLQAGKEALIEVSFYGTNGGVSMKNINGSFYDFVAERFWGTKTELLTQPPDDWGGKALLHWINKLSESNSFDAKANQYLSSAEIVEKIYGEIK